MTAPEVFLGIAVVLLAGALLFVVVAHTRVTHRLLDQNEELMLRDFAASGNPAAPEFVAGARAHRNGQNQPVQPPENEPLPFAR